MPKAILAAKRKRLTPMLTQPPNFPSDSRNSGERNSAKFRYFLGKIQFQDKIVSPVNGLKLRREILLSKQEGTGKEGSLKICDFI